MALALFGCRSPSSSHYSSPRVVGTVLDAKSHQPIEDVRVHPVGSSQQMDPNMPRRGGQLLEQQSTVFSGPDGTFVMPSVSDLTVFQKVYWYTFTLSFGRSGYETLVVTYTPAQATTTPQGEPVVNAGNIFLQPKSR